MNRSRFRILPQAAAEAELGFTFEGRHMSARHGSSVAAALLQGGVMAFRQTAVSGAARAPYCMMGVCFDCLVEIDGVPNRQACLIEIREGMSVRMQQGGRLLADTELPDE